MDSVIVLPGETLPDVAARMGSLDYWPEIALLNGLAMTATLTPGTTINLPPKSQRQEEKETQNPRKKTGNIGIAGPGQTWADLSMQYLGALDGWAELAILNGGSLTTSPMPGTAIRLPNIVQRRAQRYMFEGQYRPATGAIPQGFEGIDYMGIEFDFIVT